MSWSLRLRRHWLCCGSLVLRMRMIMIWAGWALGRDTSLRNMLRMSTSGTADTRMLMKR